MRAFDEFISGGFEFGAQASAVALTISASAEAKTSGVGTSVVSGGYDDVSIGNTNYHKGMTVFTIVKGGLMYEASIGGQKFGYTPYRVND